MAVVEADSSDSSSSNNSSESDSDCEDCKDNSDKDEDVVEPALLGEVTEHNMRLTTTDRIPDHRPKIEVLDNSPTVPSLSVSSTVSSKPDSHQVVVCGAQQHNRAKQGEDT